MALTVADFQQPVLSVRNDPVLDATAVATNPSEDDIVADTGALSTAGRYEMRIFIGQSAATTYKVQKRNAANDADVGDVLILFGAPGQTAEYILSYALTAGQRVRVLMNAALTGTVAGGITAELLN